jgi:hypothetical protein
MISYIQRVYLMLDDYEMRMEGFQYLGNQGSHTEQGEKEKPRASLGDMRKRIIWQYLMKRINGIFVLRTNCFYRNIFVTSTLLPKAFPLPHLLYLP